MWKLIIFFVASSGGSPGGNVAVVDYQTQAICTKAAAIINETQTPKWSGVKAICVPAD